MERKRGRGEGRKERAGKDWEGKREIWRGKGRDREGGRKRERERGRERVRERVRERERARERERWGRGGATPHTSDPFL